MNYAPVLISVYNRPDHFKRCIESLKKCVGAAETILFIAIDYPKDSWDAGKHDQITGYAGSITGFKRVELMIRDHNVGSKENIWSARAKIFTEYDRMIFSEDDNEFAPGFLQFMNSALEAYADDPLVFAINGYNYPIKTADIHSGDVYKFQGYCAWGAGIWRDKWSKVVWTRNSSRRFIINPKNLVKTIKTAPGYLLHFWSYVFKGRFAGDAVILTNLIANDWVVLNPVHTLVINHGCDGSGEHKSHDIRYSQQLFPAETPDSTDLVCAHDRKLIYMRLRKYFKLDLVSVIRFAYSCMSFSSLFNSKGQNR
jgi:hypothetical protein